MLTAVMLLVLSAGCATQSRMPGAEVPPPPSADGGMSPASESLLAQARAQRNAGEPGQASMTLERAIRIDPDQPALWLELARVHLDEGHFTQAEQLARKAGTLAPAGNPLRESIDAVVEEAVRRQDGGL